MFIIQIIFNAYFIVRKNKKNEHHLLCSGNGIVLIPQFDWLFQLFFCFITIFKHIHIASR